METTLDQRPCASSPIAGRCPRSTHPAHRLGLSIALGALIVVAFVAPVVDALEANRVTQSEAIERADVIFRGRASDSSVAWNARRNLPLTTVKFAVLESLKGSADRKEIELSFPGGTIDGSTYTISDLVIPQVGQEYVVFAYDRARPSVSPVVGANQWYFRLEHGAGGADQSRLLDYDGRTLVTSEAGPVVLRLDPTGARGADRNGATPTRISPDAAFDSAGRAAELSPAPVEQPERPSPVTWGDLKRSVRMQLERSNQ
jgi:hypothetical protein